MNCINCLTSVSPQKPAIKSELSVTPRWGKKGGGDRHYSSMTALQDVASTLNHMPRHLVVSCGHDRPAQGRPRGCGCQRKRKGAKTTKNLLWWAACDMNWPAKRQPYPRRMRAKTLLLPLCAGKCSCLHMLGYAAIVCRTSSVKSFGCGEVNRMRTSGTASATLYRQPKKTFQSPTTIFDAAPSSSILLQKLTAASKSAKPRPAILGL